MTSTVTPFHSNTPPVGPLTTIFTPSAAYCTTGIDRFYTFDCLPSGYSALFWYGNVGYYSPAICPLSYTNAGAPPSGFGPPVATQETAIICCPTGYTYQSLSACYGPRVSYETTATFSTSGSTVTSVSIYTTSSYAYPMQVRWQQSDLVSMATDPLTPGGVINTSITSPSSSPASSPASSSSGAASSSAAAGGGGGLSKGAEIGIGVGVGVGGLLAIILGVFLFLRRKSRRDQNMENSPISYEKELVNDNVPPPHHPAPDYASLSPADTYRSDAITEAQRASAASPTSDHGAWGGGMGGDKSGDLQRIQERKARLMELERLAAEEDRIMRNSHMGPSSQY